MCIRDRCRNTSDDLSSSGAQVIDKVDVGNPESLPLALERLKGVKIDLLINNAGVLANESINDYSPNTIEQQFLVNAMGPLLVTQLLKEQLVAGSKVALITSRMGSMTDNTSGGYYGYRMSKAALNMAGVSLAHDLKPADIAVGLFHPGYVQTEMVNYGGNVSATDASASIIERIEQLTLADSGSFYHANGDVLPW